MSSPRLTTTQWLICAIAVIGFAFDIYELLMLPLIVGPALQELIGATAAPGTPLFGLWVAKLFFIPALCGGVFGLLGGWLTDRFGRRRVLTWSILLYAFGAFAGGYSTSPEMLLFFRCLVFIGVCVEFVAAVAWLAELFPDARQREKVLGYTQAFSSIGGLLVAFVNSWIVLRAAVPGALPAIHLPGFLAWIGNIANEHAPWRYTLMSGLLPALPLIVIRPFLPESPRWLEQKQAGTLQRPSIAALFSPELRRTTVVTTLMFAMSYAAAFGAIQHMPQMMAAVPQVAQEAKAAATAAAASTPGNPKAGIRAAKAVEQKNAATITKWQEVGGLAGRCALALLALVIISRRRLIRVFLVPGLFVMPLVFAWALPAGLWGAKLGLFLAAFFTVAQFSFWGNYLPRVYPLHLRGTGESFAANIGGRMIGTAFAALTALWSGNSVMVQGGDESWLSRLYAAVGSSFPRFNDDPALNLAMVAAVVGAAVYLVNLILSFFLPEPSDP